ncbi:MAG TPA: hypothetical protein VN835_09250 [Steroidobacteraceae bacterium]|nr:hypothetical protein [Steroidobacteraceae bacterium]
MAAHFDSPADMLVASRLLQHPEAYRRWEAEHDRLMRVVSEPTRLARQVVALRSIAFVLVHRKATFEYLRDRQLTGERRRRLFAFFCGFRDYTNAVLAEHLMQDAAFDEPLRIYEQWYSEYFRAFCDVALAETEEEKLAIAPMDALKPLLKYQLAEARQAILAMPQMPAEDWREAQIRKPTGDTQRLRAIFASVPRVN